jgi:hypothetical protein
MEETIEIQKQADLTPNRNDRRVISTRDTHTRPERLRQTEGIRYIIHETDAA